jgi:hypothetical protein
VKNRARAPENPALGLEHLPACAVDPKRPEVCMFPSSTKRVAQHTHDEINDRIAREIDRSIDYHAAHPAEIPARLRALDDEWDVERVLEANASTLILLGLTFSRFVDRRWIALPVGVAAFLLQHALQGWCPPLPVLRRLGFRTMHEIDRERAALNILRDYLGEGDATTRRSRARRFARSM